MSANLIDTKRNVFVNFGMYIIQCCKRIFLMICIFFIAIFFKITIQLYKFNNNFINFTNFKISQFDNIHMYNKLVKKQRNW